MYFTAVPCRQGSSDFARAMGRTILLGAAVSSTSLLAEGWLRPTLFLAGIAVEMAAVMVVGRRGKVLPVHREHLVERVGLMSILLGESILSMVNGLRDIEWTSWSIGAAWWIYFDSFNRLGFATRMRHGFSLLYSHILFALGLGLLAAMIHHAIHSDLTPGDYRLLAISGMTFFYLGKLVVYYAVFPVTRPNIWIDTSICLAITTAATFLPRPELTLMGATGGMLVYVWANLRWTLQKDFSPYMEGVETETGTEAEPSTA